MSLVLLAFLPGNNEPPSSNDAKPDLRNYQPVLDYPTGVDRSGIRRFTVHPDYPGNGARVYIFFMSSSATGGDVDWDVFFEAQAVASNPGSDNWGSAQSSNDNSISSATYLYSTYIDFTHAQMQSPTAGQLARIKVQRGGAGETGGLAGDVEMHAVLVVAL